MEEFSDVRFKQHAVIEFLTAEKVPPIEIHRRMQADYVDQCVDVSTVRRWVRRFKDGEVGFQKQNTIFFKDGFRKLVQRWSKCIESGFGGLEVACWPLVPKFAGSNPAEAVGFFRAKKSSARLPSEGK